MSPRTPRSFDKALYYVGRGVQLVGLLITLNVVVLFFFPEYKMGPLLQLTAVGVITFFVGWLIQAR
ncbi:MAG: hypothetical protein ACOYXR_01420 [Nitrospirota bacterium]